MTIPVDIVRAAMSRTLEDMYFCEGSWAGPGFLSMPLLGARVAFSGSSCGEFRIVATSRLALQLAADFLATDVSDVAGAQASALMHELANVACGAMLSSWKPDGNFHFSVPSSLTGEEMLGQWPQRLSISDVEPELAVDIRFSRPQ